jgi:hypothetical protein
MKKLPPPTLSFSTALTEAISGIGNNADRTMYTAAFLDSAAVETAYEDGARAATLYSMPRVTGTDDPVVHGTLRKSHLTKLYTQYFVPGTKPARRLYEEIKVTANGKCPLCGGVGHVRTLDHYLPKANFPVYSVLPANLVPCCRDCNSEKLNAFAATRGLQTLHPYFDHDRFFNERWVDARVVQNDPPVVEFSVAAPVGWDADDRLRVQSHFDEYGLANKFSTEAAADLPETIQTRRTTMSASSPAEFSNYLNEKSQTLALPVNNWRRVMFAALAADFWFCTQTF